MADVEGVVKAGEAGDGKEGLMDRKWEEIQQKAFTKWVNRYDNAHRCGCCGGPSALLC